MLYKIQRHLFIRLLKAFILFTALLFLTYILLDFCLRASDFSDANGFNFQTMLIFYGCEFAKKASLFLPLCFCLAMLTQFIRLSKTKELLALLCAGISYKKILRPFWLLAICISTFLFFTREALIPPTRDFLETFKNDPQRSAPRQEKNQSPIHILILRDDSKLIYQSYNPVTHQYFDLFWIVSPDRILRIKYLNPIEGGYKAEHIDELYRNEKGVLQKKHSFKELKLSKEWLKGAHLDKVLPIQTQTLKALVNGLFTKDFLYTNHEIYTELLLVFIMSLSPLALILLQSPLLTHYHRQIPILFYIASQLIFFFSASTLLDGFGIMCQKGIASPWLLIFSPTLLFALYLYRRYSVRLS